jgi:hypothetical protein
MYMSGPITPMIVLGGVSYANNWYNTGNVTDVKPLLFAGISALLLEGVATIPGMEATATAIGWLAVVGMFLSNVQNPSPVANLVKITGGNKT